MHKINLFGTLIFVVVTLFALGAFTGFSAAHAAVIGSDYGTFNTFYQENIGVWGWVGLGFAAVLGVIITIWTLGTGTPAWCAAVGTWIGGTLGFSGAVATNVGLALLGGGSVAAGGWGIAGGVVVLVAATTFSTELLIGYTIEKACSSYTDEQFSRECRRMMHLPLPVNTSGGIAYCAAQQYIATNYDKEKLVVEGGNPQVIRDAIVKLSALLGQEADARNRVKDDTMLALLYWLSGNPNQAIQRAVAANATAKQWNEKDSWFYNYAITPTMANFILAVCRLEAEMVAEHSEAFKYSVLSEPGNKLVPLLFGIYLDRLIELYHYDKVKTKDLKAVVDIANDPTIVHHAPVVSVMLAARLLVEIKRCQQDIIVITSSTDAVIRKKANIRELLNEKLDRYNEIVELSTFDIVPMLAQHDKDIPKDLLKDLPYRYTEVRALLRTYSSQSDDLQKRIAAYNQGGD